MNVSTLLRILLVMVAAILLGNAVALQRDYQDSWVLEGLEIPFATFLVVYAITFFKEKSSRAMVALALLCSSVFVLVPNLKYVWFHGRSIDQQAPYSFATQIVADGYIPTEFKNFAADEMYASTPFMYLSFGIFSVVLDIPIVYSMKILPVAWALIYPLLTYSIAKRLKLAKGTQLPKYALFMSSLPAGAGLSYIITGSGFGSVLVLLVMFQVVRLLQENERRQWCILLFFIFILAGAHSTSSILLAVLLSAIALLQRVSVTRVRMYPSNSAMFAAITTSAWLLFSQSTKALETIIYSLRLAINSIIGTYYPKTGYIPSRFFELLAHDVLGAFEALMVYNGRDIFLLLLTLVGFMFVLKARRKAGSITKFLVLFNLVLFGSLAIGVLSKVGGGYWQRAVNFARISFPIFASIPLAMYIEKRKAGIRVLAFALIMLLTVLQFYACQPLIPSASTLSEDFPTDEPLVYVVNVNSIYQRQMVDFAERHVQAGPNRIACDRVTRNQIMGLAQVNFTHMTAWHYPLMVEYNYDYFLIHLPGRAGAFEEQVEYRTREVIVDIIENSTIFYTNGESYVLTPAFEK